MDIVKDYKNFINEFKSVNLATVDKELNPSASYAPFAIDENLNIYVCLSNLVKHTLNLKLNPKVNLMFIEDEANAKNIFARKRLSFDCSVNIIDKNLSEFENIIKFFEERFQSSSLICKLPDFVMFKFKPLKGKYIKGFGEAYEIYGKNLSEFRLKGVKKS